MYNDPQLNSYFKSRIQRRRRKRFIRFVLLVFILISVLVVFLQFLKSGVKNINLVTSRVLSIQTKNNSLKDVVDNSVQGVKGTYGIVIKNLKTGESYSTDEHRTYEAGSLYKLWTMATVYKQIENGALTEDQTLKGNIADLNEKFNIASDEAELTEGTVNYTVKSALTQMITISHNYAALILTEKVKLSSVANFLKEAGFKESLVGVKGEAPKSTPLDIALFYEKLYQGKLANQQYTAEMIELLKNQKLNGGLPKLLPQHSKIAHKTGDIGWFKHDAGIVFTDSGDYIIVVMSESNSPAAAQERIAQISKAVFDYFTIK